MDASGKTYNVFKVFTQYLYKDAMAKIGYEHMMKGESNVIIAF